MNKILSISLLVMLIVTTIALFATKENTGILPPDSSQGKAAIGGEFTLIDSAGKTVTDKTFRGKYMLVFFGFTHCPDICQTTLATFTSVLEIMKDKASLIAPIFISVDPENDTPDRIKTFLSNFDSRIVGLTGSETQTTQAAAAYKAYHSENGGSIDHSSFIYLMDKDGAYIAHFPYDISVDSLAEKLLEHVQ